MTTQTAGSPGHLAHVCPHCGRQDCPLIAAAVYRDRFLYCHDREDCLTDECDALSTEVLRLRRQLAEITTDRDELRAKIKQAREAAEALFDVLFCCKETP